MSVRSNLGEFYFRKDRLSDARKELLDVLKIRTRVLPPGHPGILISKNDLSVVYEREGNNVEAEPFIKEFLDGQRAVNPHGRETYLAMTRLAVFYYGQKKTAEAERLLAEAYAGSKRAYGDDNPDTLFIMENLGSVYMVQGKLPEAADLLEKTVKGLSKTLGPDQPDTVHAINQLAALYGRLGRAKEAEPLLRQIYQVARKRNGDEHTTTIWNIRNLGACLVRIGKAAGGRAAAHKAASTASQRPWSKTQGHPVGHGRPGRLLPGARGA